MGFSAYMVRMELWSCCVCGYASVHTAFCFMRGVTFPLAPSSALQELSSHVTKGNGTQEKEQDKCVLVPQNKLIIHL